jgi:hypothetical protein
VSNEDSSVSSSAPASRPNLSHLALQVVLPRLDPRCIVSLRNLDRAVPVLTTSCGSGQ